MRVSAPAACQAAAALTSPVASPSILVKERLVGDRPCPATPPSACRQSDRDTLGAAPTRTGSLPGAHPQGVAFKFLAPPLRRRQSASHTAAPPFASCLDLPLLVITCIRLDVRSGARQPASIRQPDTPSKNASRLRRRENVCRRLPRRQTK